TRDHRPPAARSDAARASLVRGGARRSDRTTEGRRSFSSDVLSVVVLYADLGVGRPPVAGARGLVKRSKSTAAPADFGRPQRQAPRRERRQARGEGKR